MKTWITRANSMPVSIATPVRNPLTLSKRLMSAVLVVLLAHLTLMMLMILKRLRASYREFRK